MSEPRPTKPRRRRRWLLALIALVLGLALAIGGAESMLRTFDPIGRGYEGETLRYFQQAVVFDWQGLPPPSAPGQLPPGLDLDGLLFQHRPNVDLDLGSFRVQANARGLRGPEVSVPKAAGTFRIVVLGDSVVFGWGVDDEVTFVRRLEREWNDAGHAQRLEVVNTGHPKYDTNQELAMLQKHGLALEPDLVLLVYVVNDVSEPSRDVAEAMLTGAVPHPEEQVVIPDDFWSWSQGVLQPLLPAIAQLVGSRTDLAARVARVLPPGVDYRPETFGAGPRGWARSQKALLAIRDVCRERGVPFVLFDHTLPHVPSLPTFCREHGIDYEPLFLEPEDYALGITNSRLDSHCNAKGHGILLERLRAALQRRSLLPKD